MEITTTLSLSVWILHHKVYSRWEIVFCKLIPYSSRHFISGPPVVVPYGFDTKQFRNEFCSPPMTTTQRNVVSCGQFPDTPEQTFLAVAPDSDKFGAKAIFACVYTANNISNGSFVYSSCDSDGNWSPVSGKDCHPYGMSLNFDNYVCDYDNSSVTCDLTSEHPCLIFR